MSITIRSTEQDDAKDYQRIFGKKEVQENTLQLPYPSLDSWKEKLSAYARQGKYGFVAMLDGIVAGEVTIFTNANSRLKHVVSLGLGVDTDFSGKGVGSELMRQAIRYSFDWLGARKIELEVFSDNEKAISLYRKFGFTEEGLKRGAALRHGRYEDVLLMALHSPYSTLAAP
ncbi:GNAT family N-acetyltransferase [Erwinia sp. 9145]|uniref:GNAT family N-acetyltransferase n=1 Tax=Erwinia sp. 9145 TaxID=1500895 RepID=UPI00054F92CC|nr:GNAT family N-acetyltransferase [Erwinia sp. 9145]